MLPFERSRLWKASLAARENDPYARERERLRASLIALREQAELAGRTIGRLLPELTVHDVSHADALWEVADEVAGADIEVNPVEAFILGAAFYIHDLALGLAAFPEGPEALRASPDVQEALSARLFRQLGKWPSPEEMASSAESDQRAALFEVLRRQHAERASTLLKLEIPHPDRGQPALHLLDDQDLRGAYAGLIGTVAHSHGWDVDDLRRTFAQNLGGPAWAPQWGIDRLLVACLLRLADAAHLDGRRAPAMLQALAGPMDDASRDHWTFQRRLQAARRVGDRLEFTAAEGFTADEAPAWWLCYETLGMVDRELRRVDAMLSDLGRTRLAARSVAGVDSPARLTAFVPAAGWEPVDAQIHVLDVGHLVRQLGGEELYGANAVVPLRELIQNAADAVRARRICDDRGEDFGTISVRAGGGDEDGGEWIEVEDDGLGMSVEVMRRFLLNFGTSYWTSPELPYDFPELTRSGFQPVGRYGIGFFSVFMWGSRVKVTTRRFDLAHPDARVLEFNAGIGQRPIVRPATASERVREGGTRVRVWLEKKTLSELLTGNQHVYPSTGEDDPMARRLADMCRRLAPALDVTLETEVGAERERAVEANDWLSIPAEELFARTGGYMPSARWDQAEVPDPDILRNEDGQIVGRASLGFGNGLTVVGGLQAGSVSHLGGVLVAAPVRAARDLAMPLASRACLHDWATAQAEKAVACGAGDEALLEIAATVRSLGGSVRGLPVAVHQSGHQRFDDVVRRLRKRKSIRLVQDAAVSTSLRPGEEIVLDSDVLVVSMTSDIMIQYHHAGELVSWPGTLAGPQEDYAHPPLMTSVILEAASEAWGVPAADIVMGHKSTEQVGVRAGVAYELSPLVMLHPATREAVAMRQTEQAMETIWNSQAPVDRAALARDIGVTPAALDRLLKEALDGGWLEKVDGTYQARRE